MLVHRVETGQHLMKLLRADGNHQREANRRVIGIATADPVPELEHVGGINAELRNFFRIG